MRFGINIKLMMMFAVAIAPFFIVTSYGHYNLVLIASETKQFSDYINDLNPITHVSLHINLSAKSAYNYLTTGEKKERENFQETVKHTKITMLRFTKFSFIDHYENRYYNDIIQKFGEIDKLNQQILLIDDPVNNINSKKYIKKWRKLLTELLVAMDNFQGVSSRKIAELTKEAESTQAHIHNVLLLSWFGSILFSFTLVFFASSYSSRSIKKIDNVAKEIGAGNLDQRIETHSNDELGRLVMTFNDMAEKLQKTTVSKNYFDNIIQTMNDVLFVISIDGDIQTVNQAAHSILGYNRSDLEHRPIVEIFPNGFPLQDKVDSKKVFEGEIIQKETVCVKHDGINIPVIFSLSRLNDELGSIQGFVCVVQSISFRKKAEEEIKYLSQQMIQIQEDERARISRDVHDNLGGSLMALKILFHSVFEKKIGIDNESEKDYSEIIKYLNEIINSSRQISRNLSPIGFKTVGLATAVAELANTIKKSNKMDIIVNVDDLNPFFPNHWDVNVYRIIQESLTNIVKHAGATKVEISAVENNNMLTIIVKDNGNGIDFTFKKEEKSGNMGLGLLIMRERAELLGGTFEIISKIGMGTSIKIDIPGNKTDGAV